MDPEPLFITATLVTTSQLISLALLLVLLLCSAMISGAEVAFFSLKATDLDQPDEAFTKQGLVRKLLEKPKKLLATILVANNAINIAIVLLFESLNDFFFSGLSLDGPWLFLIKVGLVTFLILLFGEILPKIYASRNSVQFSSFMAVPLKVMYQIFTPITNPMRSVTLFIQDKLAVQKTNISVDTLSQALEMTDENDTTQEEQKILQGIISFGNTETRQVMKSRVDMFALDIETEFTDVIKEVAGKGYSRVPVFKESVDKIEGILVAKDLLPYLDRKNYDWTKLLHETLFVPENKKLDDLLKEFQEKKKHLAIVVDEYGGTSGLVTLEDIIEEIVGDISDEFDDDDLVYSKLDDKNYVFEGKTPLNDLYRVLKNSDLTVMEENKGEAETLAGLILEMYGGFPRKGQRIKLEGFTFTIESMDQKRIKQVKLTLP